MTYPGIAEQLRKQAAASEAQRDRTEQARQNVHRHGAAAEEVVTAALSAEATCVTCGARHPGTAMFHTEAGLVCAACFPG